MSGTPLMLKPLPPAVTEVTYEIIMKELGLQTACTAERIQRLTTITPDELVAKTPMTVPLVPFLDGDIIPSATTFQGLDSEPSKLEANIPGRKWCEELVIGDCQHDVSFSFPFGVVLILSRATFFSSWASRNERRESHLP